MLAHHAFLGTSAERRNYFSKLQHEAREANRIQRELGCSRTEALRLAAGLEPAKPEAKPEVKESTP